MRRRKHHDLTVGFAPGYPHTPVHLLGKGLYRWRRQLLPAYVAMPMPLVGWVLALLWAFADHRWMAGTYAVAVACVVCWLIVGMRRVYDRCYTVFVALIVLGWLLAVAIHPGTGWYYGVWAIGWPLVGLGWWCGPALRSAAALDRMQQRWASVAELAGVAGAKLTAVKHTTVGRVLTVVLPGNHTAKDVSRDRIEAGYQYRRGSVTVVPDKANARRVDVHVVDRDPWENGRTIDHPVINVLPLLENTNPDADLTDTLDLNGEAA